MRIKSSRPVWDVGYPSLGKKRKKKEYKRKKVYSIVVLCRIRNSVYSVLWKGLALHSLVLPFLSNHNFSK